MLTMNFITRVFYYVMIWKFLLISIEAGDIYFQIKLMEWLFIFLLFNFEKG